jgi:type I restriction enzyme R subunit
MSNEADTCREFVVPKLNAAGWNTDPHVIAEQHTFTDGRILTLGNKPTRQKRKFADYLLSYTRDYPLAVVEAKRASKQPGDGLQQAKEYAEILGLKFAYATNGFGIVEFDYLAGAEREVEHFPTPQTLLARLQAGDTRLTGDVVNRLLTPDETGGNHPRYYQRIAINRAVQAILLGKRRALLTLATGTGKTTVAFQVCWKLWRSRTRPLWPGHPRCGIPDQGF